MLGFGGPEHTCDGTTVIEASIGSERVSVDFSDPALALLNPNHAYGTVEDAIGYVIRLIDSGADEILFLNQMGTIDPAGGDVGDHPGPRRARAPVLPQRSGQAPDRRA